MQIKPLRKMSIIEAKYAAQKLAFGPVYFQATLALRDLGILQAIREHKKGITTEELSELLSISTYGLSVLLEAGVMADLIEHLEGERFKLTKVGLILLTDEMTRVNINFTRDVCYDGLKYLDESVLKSAPVGLSVFGDFPTVYHALAHLSDDIRTSWFDFDHYYSTDSFPHALKIVFDQPVKRLMDIGGNTGKWAIECCKYDKTAEIVIVDLPGQIATAKSNIHSAGFSARVQYYETDLLQKHATIADDCDVIWMSQFLDCFSQREILKILKLAHYAVEADTRIFIMESFLDNQKYEAAGYSIAALTLYFTSIANGTSKMFRMQDLLPLIDQAGFEIVVQHDLIGNTFNTLLELKKKT